MIEYMGVEFSEIKPTGSHVLIKVAEDIYIKKIGDIYVKTTNAEENSNGRVGAAKVIAAGSEVSKYGVKENDYILYDYFAGTCGEGNALLDAKNILAIVNEDEYNKFINGTLKNIGC